MSDEEEIIRDEDCNEDKLGQGWLVLTNKRLIFRKERSRMATLSKEPGDTLLDVTLDKIKDVRTEGFIAKKLVIEIDDNVYKFGVLGTKGWMNDVKEAIADYSK
ncbi:MAG: hypothetical protein KatS3mg003_1243 [Candidatus Nitrosocaldaceae archaeon]|nr:MAG: hypothetical protein KatS3mg003_1243 [Candidatus Nitrosocaldaceae archaeon]